MSTIALRFIVCLFTVLLPSQADGQFKKLKEKIASRQKLTPEEKQEREYERLKAFALNLYETDESFRNAVDREHEQLLRAHSVRAYETNVSAPARTVVVREDRFRVHEDNSLYDNMLVQGYVNRLGQSLVPATESGKFYTFRLISYPIPFAEALATGTVYISTGLVSLLENEAQLAFVLAHEMAHVHLDHWKLKPALTLAMPAFEQEQSKKHFWTRLALGVGGAVVGGALGGKEGAAIGLVAGSAASLFVGTRLNTLEWDSFQEDEADHFAFKALLDSAYDVKQITEVYAGLNEAALLDSRVTLGFVGRPERLRERMEAAEALIAGAEEEQGLDGLGLSLLVDTSRYRELMAELRRDNGIQALLHDMFHMAKSNLEEAVAIRSTDPVALYYYAKVLKTVGRTDDEMALAKEMFGLSGTYDERNRNFGAHLHHAMALLSSENVTTGDRALARAELQRYLNDYADYKEKDALFSTLPPHIDTLFDYMLLNNEADWAPELPDAPDLVPVQAVGGTR